MWGPSVFNTHILPTLSVCGLRLGSDLCVSGMPSSPDWRDVICNLLERTNPHHSWLLHYLFLNMINEDCQKEWNAHLISGVGGGQSLNFCTSQYVSTQRSKVSVLTKMFMGTIKMFPHPQVIFRVTLTIYKHTQNNSMLQNIYFRNFYPNGQP